MGCNAYFLMTNNIIILHSIIQRGLFTKIILSNVNNLRFLVSENYRSRNIRIRIILKTTTNEVFGCSQLSSEIIIIIFPPKITFLMMVTQKRNNASVKLLTGHKLAQFWLAIVSKSIVQVYISWKNYLVVKNGIKYSI